MINESNFIVRISGKRENSFYIDYSGTYKLNDIAKLTGTDVARLKQKYLNNGADLDESLDVYYFGSIDNAKRAIEEILKDARSDQRGKGVFLSAAEIEFIRKALINENSNTIHVKNNIKDAIFKKLNG